MESVLKKIRDARNEDNQRRADTNGFEAVIDGCNVRVHFDPLGDNSVLPLVKNTLIAAHLETVIAGGVVV